MSKVIVLERPFNLKPYSRKEFRYHGSFRIHLKKWAEKIEPSIGNPIAGMYKKNIQVKSNYRKNMVLPTQVVNNNLQDAA